MTALFVNANAPAEFTHDDFLVFFHAQRTGGSALRHVLGRALGREHIYCTQFVDNFQHWPKTDLDELSAFKAFAGHSNFEPREMDRRQRFITLLRHPVYRTISIYYYAKKYENQFLHHLTDGRSLQEFYYVASEKKPVYFHNVMCRRVSGQPNFEAARDNIESQYWAVGLTEKFGTFVDFLLEALGCPAEVQPDHGFDCEKYVEQASDVPFVQDIMKANAEDVKLFEYMNEKYFNITPDKYPKLGA